MSVLLALPQSIAMHSPPVELEADFSGNHQGVARSAASSGRPTGLLRRTLEGRISRPRSSSSLSLSLRNQQILWESVTGRNWQADILDPIPESIQSLQYITPQSLSVSVSPAPSLAPSSPAASLERLAPPEVPVSPADIGLDTQGILEFVGYFPASRTLLTTFVLADSHLQLPHRSIISDLLSRTTPRVCETTGFAEKQLLMCCRFHGSIFQHEARICEARICEARRGEPSTICILRSILPTSSAESRNRSRPISTD